jgi:Tol biopolymer transport system component
VDINTSGVGAGGDVLSAPLLSADGSLVFFESSGNAFVANDRNREIDIFMRDANAVTTTLISAHHPSLVSASPNGYSSVTAQPISADGRFIGFRSDAQPISTDGRFIAFRSDADNLVASDTNQLLDVFVRDLTTGSNVLVSVSSSGAQGNGLSIEPAISGNGRYVAFTSTATNFFAGDANKLSDVFVRDLQTGTTLPVSVIASGASTANGDSYSPAISADGRYVLYRSTFGGGINLDWN